MHLNQVKVGNLVICRFDSYKDQVGNIVEVRPGGAYYVHDLDGKKISGSYWSDPNSFDHIRIRDMTDADRKIGVELIGTTGRYTIGNKVGIIESLTGTTGFYVKDKDGRVLGGGWWAVKDKAWQVIEVIPYEDLEETEDIDDPAKPPVSVSSPSQSKLCHRKYYGVGDCTCGTCQLPMINLGFVKFKY